MVNGNKLDFDTIDYRALSPEAWIAFRDSVIDRARRERSIALGAAIKRMARAIGRSAFFAADAVHRGWLAFVAWQTARRDIATLGALDDGTLKDIGLRRSEIESIVRKPQDPTRHEHLKKAA